MAHTLRRPPSHPQPGEKRRLLPYVSADLYSRLSEYCAAKGQTQSAVVEAALGDYLNEARDDLLVMRRLDRLGRAQDRTQRDQEIMSLAFGTFLQIWFAHTPSLPPDARDAARRTAASRYKQFLEHTAEQFSHGHRFLDDLPKDTFADEAELEAIATGAHDQDEAGSRTTGEKS
jgi:hypothetical protein